MEDMQMLTKEISILNDQLHEQFKTLDPEKEIADYYQTISLIATISRTIILRLYDYTNLQKQNANG